MLELSNLTKAYEEGGQTHTVLKRLDLTVERGEIVVIYGKSGSGKSTLLNMISGIDIPSFGSVMIDGNDITSMSDRERTLFRRRYLGFIFQFFNLIPTLTVIENLLLPLELVNNQPGKAWRGEAEDLLGEVELRGRKNTYPDRLSGGEQQRVAIARSIIHEPALILADEPTGNLDYETGKIVLGILDDMVRKKGKTMIMATHSREIIGMADRVLQLYNGKLTTL